MSLLTFETKDPAKEIQDYQQAINPKNYEEIEQAMHDYNENYMKAHPELFERNKNE